MRSFLSEGAIAIHEEYLRNLRLKRSILVKSINGGEYRNISEIPWQKIPHDIKNELAELGSDIKLHEIFFSSFGDKSHNSERVRAAYGSVGAFLNHLYSVAISSPPAFLTVGLCGGKISVELLAPTSLKAGSSDIRLALDLFEHAYFLDYGFDRRAYILAALSRLNLSLLD